jgi:hypothetical protein
MYIKEESPDVYPNGETIYLPSSYDDHDELLPRHSPISLQNDLVSSDLAAEEVRIES